jgi:hypothetical protein
MFGYGARPLEMSLSTKNRRVELPAKCRNKRSWERVENKGSGNAFLQNEAGNLLKKSQLLFLKKRGFSWYCGPLGRAFFSAELTSPTPSATLKFWAKPRVKGGDSGLQRGGFAAKNEADLFRQQRHDASRA